jgi:5-methyltetrahydropteroyltriglutamate--homocysteine methyltransferase
LKRSTDRILTTHAGSLPRPQALLELAGSGTNYGRGEASIATVGRDVLRESVAEVVQHQASIGIDVPNDGEFGKSSWTGYVNERLLGFEARPSTGGFGLLQRSYDMRTYADYYNEAWSRGTLWHSSGTTPPSAAPMQYVCTAPLRYDATAVNRDIDNFKAALAGVPSIAEAFMPVAAPASIEVGRQNEHYASEDEFVFAIAETLSQEYAAIVNAGFVVQIDDAWVPALWDTMLPNVDLDQYKRYVGLRIDALNHALRDLPRDRVRYHLCWGSWHGPHVSDIPMAEVAPIMLQVKAGAYVFEAGNVRHEHEYHVWENLKLTEGQALIPGVVSHATNVVEHPDLVAERIVRYAERAGHENVLAGTDCGLGGRVHPQVAWAKLEALVEGARVASKRLWA